MEMLSALNEEIPLWGTAEAVKKEAHVARFLEREYQAAREKGWGLEELGVSTKSGPMWEETSELISSHYDEKIDFFRSFLDERFQAYSMAFYGDTAVEAKNSPVTLSEAQRRKFDLICERAEIKGDENVLNIGCGFGSLEKYLLERFPNLRITGLTPSQVQADYLREQIADSASPLGQGNFCVVQKDFSAESIRELQPGSFDLVISIGLLEQLKNMEAFNERISSLLRKGGRSFHHFIVSKMAIPQFLDARKTLIGNYFPGGRIWPYDAFSSRPGPLEFQKSWFVNGMNYWRTLDEWHKRFSSRVGELSRHLPMERIRHWNDYFILCKACFLPAEGEWFGNGHYLFRKSSS